jgi:hypothetical protein
LRLSTTTKDNVNLKPLWIELTACAEIQVSLEADKANKNMLRIVDHWLARRMQTPACLEGLATVAS